MPNTSVRGSAAPLPSRTRRVLEKAFGRCLRDIRTSTVPELASYGLEAAACGDLVVLARADFDGNAPEGRELLGHEVAHCLQQRWLGRAIDDRGAPRWLDDPILEAVAGEAGARVRAGRPVPARWLSSGWPPRGEAGPRVALDVLASAAGRYLQPARRGGLFVYGSDVDACPACNQPTEHTPHEITSSVDTDEKCRGLLQALSEHGLGVLRTGTDSASFNRQNQDRKFPGFQSVSDANDQMAETAKGYMLGVLQTTNGIFYAACSGPADTIPEQFDGIFQMVGRELNLRPCRDDLPLDGLKSRGGSVITLASVNATQAPRSNLPGNCAAPKLIQQCLVDRHTPMAMSEIMFAPGQPSHNKLIESCDTCKRLLPIMLCPRSPSS